MSTISSSTTTTTAYVVTADTTGALVLQTGATPTTAVTVGTDQSVTFAQAANLPNTFGFKNRLINGGMVIDQRNAGASVTPNLLAYPVDRTFGFGSVTGKFSCQQNSGSVTPPTGFTNYIGAVSLSAYSVPAGEQYIFGQVIEGLNVADLGWGTAGASTVTLSFWVRSSLTGSFGGSLQNSAFNRSYPFAYTISAVNTWEYKTITIAGDTTGTWLTTNGVGIRLGFSLGAGSTMSGTAGAWAGANYVSATGATSVVGTNGATFYITGVQLEKGSTATSFDYRPYGTELALCQRYYYKVVTAGAAAEVLAPNGFADSTTTAFCWTQFPVSMRTAPTALEQTGTAANYQVRYTGGSSATCSSVPTFNSASVWGARSVFTVASGLTGGQAVALQTAATANIYLAWSAEL